MEEEINICEICADEATQEIHNIHGVYYLCDVCEDEYGWQY